MNDIEKIYTLFKLKEVERYGKVKERCESTAEHTYSALILAQYFLPKIKQKLDELKVMKMLLFHDVVEIEAGDTFVLSSTHTDDQREKELKAFNSLKDKLPKEIVQGYEKLWLEYESNNTFEAKFCQAIDKLDPVVHSIFKKVDWKINKFTEKKLRNKKEKYFVDFPEIMEFFNKLINYAKEHDYFVEE